MKASKNKSFIFGVHDPLPLRGFPPGNARIRQRSTQYVEVFIRPPDGGVRRFFVKEVDGAWRQSCAYA